MVHVLSPVQHKRIKRTKKKASELEKRGTCQRGGLFSERGQPIYLAGPLRFGIFLLFLSAIINQRQPEKKERGKEKKDEAPPS